MITQKPITHRSYHDLFRLALGVSFLIKQSAATNSTQCNAKQRNKYSEKQTSNIALSAIKILLLQSLSHYSDDLLNILHIHNIQTELKTSKRTKIN